MTICALQSHDLSALLGLYAHLHTHDEPPPCAEAAEAVWSEALANPRIRYLGGFADGVLVASCALTVIPNLTRACRPYGVIENVVTHAAHRKQGWGSAVLAQALDEAWRQCCYKVMLLTGSKNEATLRFYEQAGFDRQGKQAFVARPVAGAMERR